MILAQNRKASHDYFFLKEYTAGIQLMGSEVKQIRTRIVSLVDSFCVFDKGELFVKNMHIPANEEAFKHEPLRSRKLLLKRAELKKIERELEDGITIVVKQLFTNERNLIKVQIALAKGKKNFDKRASIKEKELKKEIRQNL